MREFDDSRLDCPEALEAADERLRQVASAGARVRVETEANAAVLASLEAERPRAVLALGAEARLLRAVLEPHCPVPFVAWPGAALPAWVGPLDLVVALAPAGADETTLTAVREAARRGARLLVAAPAGAPAAEVGAGRQTTTLVTKTGDPHVAAVVALLALHAMGLGPLVSAEAVADSLDQAAEACAPRLNLAENPAKSLACGLGDAVPLVWGPSVLAARASRRVAEALREAGGRPALAGEASDLLPIIEQAEPRDPFADPEDEPLRPVLLVLEDHAEDAAAERASLLAACERHGVRVETMTAADGGPVERYASLLAQGMYAAAYVRLAMSPNE